MIMMAAMFAVLVSAGHAAPPAPTVEQLKNATYTGIYDGPITLKDGAYEGEPSPPDSSLRPRAGLLPATRVAGDLDGDGKAEAAVLVWRASGGSGVFTYLAVVADKGDTVANVATALIGDRVQVQALSIAGRRIVVDVVGHGPGEPMCCPTQKQRRTWEFTDTGLREASTQVLGPLTLADLEGKTWTLTRLDRDQPLPDNVRVTLTVKNGRVDGIGGCNSYSGPITGGSGARSIRIGPLISTRKFCEGAGSEVEAKYLAALQAVFEFGFAAGELALSYKDGDGLKTLSYSGM